MTASPQVTSQKLDRSRGAVAVRDTDDEVADSGNQAGRQTNQPYADRWRLDHDIREQEDQDPEEPGQFDLPAAHVR